MTTPAGPGRPGTRAAARDLFAELLPVRERVLGPEHPHTLNTRANLATWTGIAGIRLPPATSTPMLPPVRERVLGPEHPRTLMARHDHARWTGEAGDAAAARDLFAELLPVRERVLGTQHPDTVATRQELVRWTRRASGRCVALRRVTATFREHPSEGFILRAG